MNTRMRQERIEKGWTQLFVAEQVGLSLTAVQKMETGQRNPSYPVLVKLENLFGLSHRQLFADTEVAPEAAGGEK